MWSVCGSGFYFYYTTNKRDIESEIGCVSGFDRYKINNHVLSFGGMFVGVRVLVKRSDCNFEA